MDDADERLFRRIMNNNEHVLQPFLPDRPDLSYNLRRRPHCNKSLITKIVDLSNNDYIIRATYKDSYWNYSKPKQFYHCIFICFTYLYFHFFLICIMVAFVNFLINERDGERARLRLNSCLSRVCVVAQHAMSEANIKVNGRGQILHPTLQNPGTNLDTASNELLSPSLSRCAKSGLHWFSRYRSAHICRVLPARRYADAGIIRYRFLPIKFNFCRKKFAAKFLCVKISSSKVVATSILYLTVHRWIAGDDHISTSNLRWNWRVIVLAS